MPRPDFRLHHHRNRDFGSPLKFDAHFAGPITTGRKRTDRRFSVAILVVWVFMVLLSLYALGEGEPYRLTFGVDGEGDFCTKFLYYPNPFNLGIAWCLDDCPPYEVVGNYVLYICKNGTTVHASSLNDSTCFEIYPNHSLFSYCIPDSEDLEMTTLTLVETEEYTEVVELTFIETETRSGVDRGYSIDEGISGDVSTRGLRGTSLGQGGGGGGGGSGILGTSVTQSLSISLDLGNSGDSVSGTTTGAGSGAYTNVITTWVTETETIIPTSDTDPYAAALDDLADHLTGGGLTEVLEDILYDLSVVWQDVLLAVCAATFLCLLWLLLMKSEHVAVSTVFRLSSTLLFISVVLSGFLSARTANEMWKENETSDLQWSEYRAYVMYGGAVFCLLFLIAVGTVFSSLRKEMRDGIDLLGEGVRLLSTSPALLAVPFLALILFFLLTALFMILIIFVYTIDLKLEEDETTGMLEYRRQNSIIGIGVSVVFSSAFAFSYLWSVATLLGIVHMTIAGVVSSRYYAKALASHDISISSLVSRSFWTTLQYHWGSAAFAGLVGLLVQPLRPLIAAYVDSEWAEEEDGGNEVITFCEKLYLGLNKNGMIQTVVYGLGFADSATHVTNLFMRNHARVVGVMAAVEFMVFCGQACIVFVVFVGLFINLDSKDDLNFVGVPLMLGGLVSCCVTMMILSLHDTTGRTLLISVCEDCERNDGSRLRPYFMSNVLRHLVVRISTRYTKKIIVEPVKSVLDDSGSEFWHSQSDEVKTEDGSASPPRRLGRHTRKVMPTPLQEIDMYPRNPSRLSPGRTISPGKKAVLEAKDTHSLLR
eukprot:Rmarinus@m.13962